MYSINENQIFEILTKLESRTEALERALNTLVNELNSKNSLRTEALERALNTLVNELNSKNNLQIPTIPNIIKTGGDGDNEREQGDLAQMSIKENGLDSDDNSESIMPNEINMNSNNKNELDTLMIIKNPKI
jgi:hypothetical protein